MRFKSPHFHIQSERQSFPWKNICKLASGAKQDIQRNVCVPEDRGEKALTSKKHGKLGKDYPLKNMSVPHHFHQILMESFHAVLQQNKMYFKEPKATLDIIIPDTRSDGI